MHFYESGSDKASEKDWDFKSSFSQKEARYFYWKLDLSFPRIETSKVVNFAFAYCNQEGIVGEGSFDTWIEKNTYSLWQSSGVGFHSRGQWKRGKYLVEIKLEGRIIAQKYFKIN